MELEPVINKSLLSIIVRKNGISYEELYNECPMNGKNQFDNCLNDLIKCGEIRKENNMYYEN